MSPFRTAIRILIFFAASLGCVSAQDLSVKFKVEDVQTGSLSNASVRLVEKQQSLREEKTNSDGVVHLKLLLNKEYSVILSKEGFDSKVISVSTLVPNSQLKLAHEFPQIKVVLNKEQKEISIGTRSASEIFFNPKEMSFNYKSSGSKKIKDLNIPEKYLSTASIESSNDQEKKKEEQLRNANAALEKSKLEAERKSREQADQKKAENDLKESSQAREKKQEMESEVSDKVLQSATEAKEESIKPENEEVLLQKKSADLQIDIAIKTGMEAKIEREKKISIELQRERELQENRNSKYEKANPFNEMMNAAFESDSNIKKKP